MKKFLSFVIICLVGVTAWWLVRVPPPPPEASLSFASTTVFASQPSGVGFESTSSLPPQMITVHVAGAVNKPGVYRLRFGARINDGVIAAGGATSSANVDVVNLATVLNDGEQIYLPKRGEKPHTIVVRPQMGGAAISASNTALPGVAGGANGASPALINVNTASVLDLEQLPGVGPATAKAIVAYREKYGVFSRVEDLLKVRGIGPAKLSEIFARVRVD